MTIDSPGILTYCKIRFSRGSEKATLREIPYLLTDKTYRIDRFNDPGHQSEEKIDPFAVLIE
jgi:hypothetical protein